MRTKRILAIVLTLGMLVSAMPAVSTAEAQGDDQPYDLTPPRLSLADGQVSFWRPGADDWTSAQVNTPLAPGDEISTASPGNVEIQIGPNAFVRGWTRTQIGLENQEPGFIQLKVTDGSAAFDLRRLGPGSTVEIDTPNAAFTIAQPGYYRLDVNGDRTSFITRRAGRATVIPVGGAPLVITPSEEVVIDGLYTARVASYVAPPLDSWDQWNYTRTDRLLEVVSARYVGPDVYGASDLDRYGAWRVVPDYGAVWVPAGLRAGWTPYSTGSWIRDPVYGWTWVDTAPWGWAPYHYGRWVNVDGFWAWAPGPVMARPLYAPALVAFFDGPEVGGPVVGWVALGWGEPVVPWWGRAGFIREPSWRGWGGPRVVNNAVVTNTTVVNVQNISVYRNASVKNAVMVVNQDRFGRGPITSAREARFDERALRPIHDAPQVASRPASFVPSTGRGVRPPEESVRRPVVAMRAPHPVAGPAPGAEPTAGSPAAPASAPRLVTPPPQPSTSATVPPRPPFGQSAIERPVTMRNQAPPPGRTLENRDASQGRGPRTIGATAAPAEPGRAVAPQATPRRVETPPATAPAPIAPPSATTPTPTAPPSAPARSSPPAAAPTPPSVSARSTPPATAPASTAPLSAPAHSSPQPSAQRRTPPQAAAPASPLQVQAQRAARTQMERTDGSQPARHLPGEPANRLSPNRTEAQQGRGER